MRPRACPQRAEQQRARESGCLLQRRRMPKVLSISEKSSGRDSAHSASHPETRSSVYGMDPLQSVRNGAHITYYVCPFTSTFTLTRQRIACALRRRCHPRSRCTRDAVGIFHRGWRSSSRATFFARSGVAARKACSARAARARLRTELDRPTDRCPPPDSTVHEMQSPEPTELEIA